MKSLFAILCFLLALSQVHAQNLVPNPSFEDTVSCPDNLNQVDRASGWFVAGGTPDYFNSCFIYTAGLWNVDVPKNSFGYQFPVKGHAYVGMATYCDCIRECVGTTLTSPLQIGEKYYVSFFINLHNALQSSNASNKFGAYLSNKQYSFNDAVPLLNQSQVYSDLIVIDTVKWIKIKGSFIADSAYTYLYLGNFFEKNKIDTIQFTGPANLSYYYLDAVCLSTDSVFADRWTSVSNLQEVHFEFYPSPASDNVYINPGTKDAYSYKLITILGQVILSDKAQGPINVSLEQISSGPYLLQIECNNQILNRKLIVLH